MVKLTNRNKVQQIPINFANVVIDQVKATYLEYVLKDHATACLFHQLTIQHSPYLFGVFQKEESPKNPIAVPIESTKNHK